MLEESMTRKAGRCVPVSRLSMRNMKIPPIKRLENDYINTKRSFLSWNRVCEPDMVEYLRDVGLASLLCDRIAR